MPKLGSQVVVTQCHALQSFLAGLLSAAFLDGRSKQDAVKLLIVKASEPERKSGLGNAASHKPR